MKILALEFSSAERSVAAFDSAAGIGAADAIERAAGHTHAFALIEEALRQAGWERDAVECLVVGIGPGSYTGIRLAISVVQGWQLASAIRALAVGSIEALAEQARTAGVTGTAHFAINAQRGEFYGASYELSPAGRHNTEPLRLVSRAEVETRARTGPLFGPEVKELLGAAENHFPRASTLARLAAGKTGFVRACELEPVYLRPVQFVKAPPARTL